MHRLLFPSAVVLLATLTSSAAASVIYSNNPAPGDFFTNPTGSNQGQAVGTSGWYYNNTRNSAVVGINTTYARNGNASVYFHSPSGAGKADFEFLPSAVNSGGNFFAGSSLAPFSQLQSFSYDWYRDSLSTNPSIQHPVIRVLLDRDGDLTTIGDRGGLVFERVYNSLSVPTDTWVSDTVTSSTYVWSFGLGLSFAYDLNGNSYGYDETLADWQAFMPNAVIIGFSVGVGSGWNGQFYGAADNIRWTINNTTFGPFNLETQEVIIPEPTTIALLALGLAGVGMVVRRRSKPLLNS
jgi:hypothetical protein